ncbi:Asp/Glu/hydantoin racemase [Calycina marina]|uniref:Asp/Glu/hydantoin racemase n=1 Tax=Calycina marina TaxID=1763456 RepID=A0A9P7YTT8_9HELO|nr:Asp/Glu/hydantoin racemase [Calycina marina]
MPLLKVMRSSTRSINALLINPNGTSSMTEACLRSLEQTLPPYCTVIGFTTPYPTPSAIEGHLDGVLSAAAAYQAVIPVASEYDGFLVACFSADPLVNSLRKELSGPVIGIMEASLYAVQMLGGRLGVIATGQRSKIMHEDAI